MTAEMWAERNLPAMFLKGLKSTPKTHVVIAQPTCMRSEEEQCPAAGLCPPQSIRPATLTALHAGSRARDWYPAPARMAPCRHGSAEA